MHGLLEIAAVEALGVLFRSFAARDAPDLRPRRILVSGFMGMGDALMMAPVLLRLKRILPAVRITWLAPRSSFSTGVVRELDLADDSIAVDLADGVAARWRVLAEVRRRRFDCFLSNNHVPGWWLAPALRSIPIRVGHISTDGWRSLWDPLFNRPVQYAQAEHTILRNLRLLRPFGERILVPRPEEVRLTPPPLSRLWRHHLGDGPYVVLHPGASPGLRWKCWPPERFRAVAEAIVARGPRVVVLCTADELEFLAPLLEPRMAGIVPAVQETAREMLSLVGGACLLVGNDSGPAHAAAFFGVPTVTIFGATDPRICRPWGEKHTIVRSRYPDCPFHRFDHGAPPEPARARACMEAIPTEEVARAVLERLAEALSNREAC